MPKMKRVSQWADSETEESVDLSAEEAMAEMMQQQAEN